MGLLSWAALFQLLSCLRHVFEGMMPCLSDSSPICYYSKLYLYTIWGCVTMDVNVSSSNFCVVSDVGLKGRPYNNSTSQQGESFAQFRLASWVRKLINDNTFYVWRYSRIFTKYCIAIQPTTILDKSYFPTKNTVISCFIERISAFQTASCF